MRMSRLQVREAIAGYLFIAPWFIGFLVFVLGALVMALGVSLTEWNLLTPPTWVGPANYRRLAADPLFWQSLKVTFNYTISSVPLGIVAGYTIALLMNQKLKGLSFWRTIYYFPAVISGVAVSLLWMWVFNPDFGVLNLLLSLVGIKGPGWITDRTWALPSLVIMSLWTAGGSMVIYLAGMQSIPTELYEAAEIDGSNAWNRLLHITLPMTTPVIFFNLIMSSIAAFQVFTQAYVITDGGPANATLLYALYLYNNAFKYFKMGYASAQAWVLFLVILVVTLVLFRSAREWVFYAGEEGGQ